MTRRRVLIVAYNFPPNAAVGTMRTLRLVEQLAAETWDVGVLTADPSTYLPGEPIDVDLVRRVPASVHVSTAGVWRPLDRLTRTIRQVVPHRRDPSCGDAEGGTHRDSSVASERRGLARRVIDIVDAVTSIPDQESGWILPAVVRGVAMSARKRPDVIYSTAPSWSAQVVGLHLARLFGCRWVADFRDPWARGPWREDRSPITMAAWRRLERTVVHRADAVVFNTRRIRDEFTSFYGVAIASKLHVIPNGCDVSELDTIQRRPSDQFVLLHAGSLYGRRDAVDVVGALASALQRGTVSRDRFRLRFLGASADGAMLALLRELDLTDVVEFLPRVTRRESLQQIASASALLVLQPGHALSVPAKTYEYLAAGCPILAVTDDGETAVVVRESGVGVVAAAGDAVGIEAALQRVIEMTACGVSAPPRSVYDGATRASELAAVLGSIVATSDLDTPVAVVAPPDGSHRA